jgi:hypothetical protein
MFTANILLHHVFFIPTVKPVLRGHLWLTMKNWSFSTGDLLKEVQFI